MTSYTKTVGITVVFTVCYVYIYIYIGRCRISIINSSIALWGMWDQNIGNYPESRRVALAKLLPSLMGPL